MKATTAAGDLAEIPNAEIVIPTGSGRRRLTFRIMPDIGDQKGATYNPEEVMGRSSPIMNFSKSEARKISIDIHFITLKKSDIDRNRRDLWAIMSCCYPRDGQAGMPYRPPAICKLKFGKLLGSTGVCAVLENYSIKYPTDQVIDPVTLFPYKFDVSTSWQILYASSKLPGAEKIITAGGSV